MFNEAEVPGYFSKWANTLTQEVYELYSDVSVMR